MAKQDGLVNQSFHGIIQRQSILVMDDQIERHDLFLRFLGPEFDSIYTAEAMLSILEEGALRAEILFWDHDLGLHMNGTEMVQTIVSKNIEMPSVKKIFVHSANPAGNRNMVMELQKHYPSIISAMTPISYLNDEFKNLKGNREAFKAFLLGD